MSTTVPDRHQERLTVLLVETSPSLRHLLAELLQGEGFTVNEARSADEAVHRAQATRPDLIVLHLPPRKAGADILEELQRHPDTRGVPLIGVGRSGPSAGKMFEGVDVLLPGAVDRDILLEHLWEVINLRVLGDRGPSARRRPQCPHAG
jgi:CheY-like chemotaxis protein